MRGEGRLRAVEAAVGPGDPGVCRCGLLVTFDDEPVTRCPRCQLVIGDATMVVHIVRKKVESDGQE